jgi:hypothetical protein
MSKEFFILTFLWIISIITLFSISRGRTRLTQITFLFTQALAWLFEFTLVFFGLVKFPYREFKIATNMSFSLYYLIFPTVGVLFILFYPKKPIKLNLLLYYLFFSMVVPTFSSLAEKYSKLIQFINWNWEIHVIADLIIFYILKKFIFWFQKGIEKT